jgi:hypothetical protein
VTTWCAEGRCHDVIVSPFFFYFVTHRAQPEDLLGPQGHECVTRSQARANDEDAMTGECVTPAVTERREYNNRRSALG